MHFASAYKPEDCRWVSIEDQYKYFWRSGPQSTSFQDESSMLFYIKLCILYFFSITLLNKITESSSDTEKTEESDDGEGLSRKDESESDGEDD